MSDIRDIYPMPSFAGLEVADTAASSRFYQDALGFTDIFTMPNPSGMPMLVHLRWVKWADVLLRPAFGPPAGPKGLGFGLTFTVFEGGLDGVDALFERARAHGATIVTEPGNRPWNARDFTVADPDGFRLTFTRGPVKTDLSFDEVMKQANPATA
ncbi:MAG: VOC family protein [Bauldia sp.]